MLILQPDNVELIKVFYYDQSKRSHNMSVPPSDRQGTTAMRSCGNNPNHNNNSSSSGSNGLNKQDPSSIKKDIFGNKWVLKVNEQPPPKGTPGGTCRGIFLLIVFLLVLLSFLVTLTFGVILSINNNIFEPNTTIADNNSAIIDTENGTIFVSDNGTSKTIGRKIELTTLPMNLDGASSTTIGALNVTAIARVTTNAKVNATTLRINPYCKNCTADQVCMKLREMDKPKCVPILDKRDPTGCGGRCKLNTEYCKNLDKHLNIFQCLELKTVLKCPGKTFNCGHACLGLDKRCDGQVDCPNMSDEMNCDGLCKKNLIPCLDGECIPKEKLCDNVFDCADKSDEPPWCQRLQSRIT